MQIMSTTIPVDLTDPYLHCASGCFVRTGGHAVPPTVPDLAAAAECAGYMLCPECGA